MAGRGTWPGWRPGTWCGSMAKLKPMRGSFITREVFREMLDVRVTARGSAKRMKKDYEKDGNPIHAWVAICHLRPEDRFPDWILEYLERCAGCLEELLWRTYQGEKVSNQEIVDALGLKGRQFSKFLPNDGELFGTSVELNMRDGDKEIYAIKNVAEQFGVSAATVRRGWKRYLAEVPGVAERIRNFKK